MLASWQNKLELYLPSFVNGGLLGGMQESRNHASRYKDRLKSNSLDIAASIPKTTISLASSKYNW